MHSELVIPYNGGSVRTDVSEPRATLLIYENEVARRNAKTFCDSLAGDGTMQRYLWRVDLLDSQEWATAASEDARRVDMMIISLDFILELSPAVKHSLEFWLTIRRSQRFDLVGIVTEEYSDASSGGALRRYLKGVAQRAAVNFLFFEAATDITARRPLFVAR